jgi:MarR family transcriptional regulator, transcriptional regulator for hemolysin
MTRSVKMSLSASPAGAPHELATARTPAHRGEIAAAEALPIGRLIHDVARLRRTVFDSETQPAGITRSQFSVLAFLGRHDGDALMQSDIAKALEIGKVTLGGLIDRLEAKGFVRREASAGDRRVKRVVLTPKGKRAVSTMNSVRPIVDDLVMRGLSPMARKRVAEGLSAIRENLLRMQRSGTGHSPAITRRLRSLSEEH